MSEIQCWEMLDSMSGSISNEAEQGEMREVKRRYLIGQCLGFNSAVDEIEQYAPQYVNSDGAGLYWVRTRLDINSVGNRYFDCTATYQTLQPKDGQNQDNENPVPGSVSWDTSGHTEHMTQALSTQSWGDGGLAPDFQGAINVSGTSVNGIDVVSPGMKYSETWILPVSLAMSCSYIGAIYSLTGTVNAKPFRCFGAGEALFLGARGQWSGDQPYVSVTFEFEARPNKTIDLSESGTVLGAVFEKKGWEYVWFLYKTDEDANTLIQRPVAVYLNRLYKELDWSGLQITNAPASLRSGAQQVPVNPPVGQPA